MKAQVKKWALHAKQKHISAYLHLKGFYWLLFEFFTVLFTVGDIEIEFSFAEHALLHISLSKDLFVCYPPSGLSAR